MKEYYPFPHYTVHLGEYGNVIEQKYKIVVHIEYSSGEMDIIPCGLYQMGDTRNCLMRVRKLVRMSAEYDLRSGADTLRQWRDSIQDDHDFIFYVHGRLTAEYDKLAAEIDPNDKHYKSKMKSLRAKLKAEEARLDARTKRVNACAKIIEETAERYGLNERK